MDQNSLTLNSLFEDGYKIYESFETREDPTNSSEYQVNIKNIQFQFNVLIF
jgi:hypothetical protein